MIDEGSKKENILDENEIYIKEIIEYSWNSKWIIISITSFFAIFSVFFALSIPNQFSSTVLLKLSENSNQSKSRSLSTSVGSLASLAGIQVPGDQGNKSFYAIETLQSKDFVKHLLTFPNIKENIFAAIDFDGKEIQYNQDIFDSNLNKWVREPSAMKSIEPSYIEVHEELMKKLYISQDKDSSFIRISYEHFSPFFAYDFLNLMVQEVNNVTRKRDLIESEMAIDYFNKQLLSTQQRDIQIAINSLIEGHLKTQMLANVREDYLLTPVDPAYIPEKKSAPARSIICILITFFGGMFSLIIVLIRFFADKSRLKQS
tara:strand:+ start:933 stop:1880 length:948 start_codon:yes stop_codon:yes gene_type:complete